VAVSTIRAVTEKHGAAMRAREKRGADWPDRAGVPMLLPRWTEAWFRWWKWQSRCPEKGPGIAEKHAN